MSATVLSAHPGATDPAGGFDGLGMDTPAHDLEALARLVTAAARGAHDAFNQGLRLNGRVRVLEVGSWVGRTALCMHAALAKPYFGPFDLYCVDTFQGSGVRDKAGLLAYKHGPAKVFRTFCKNVGDKLFNTIFPLKGTSLEWAAVWPTLHLPLDLVFIDAGHSYEEVKADIQAWAPHVRKGGILAGHDYGFAAFPGVQQAVDECGKDGFEGTVWYRRM